MNLTPKLTPYQKRVNKVHNYELKSHDKRKEDMNIIAWEDELAKIITRQAEEKLQAMSRLQFVKHQLVLLKRQQRADVKELLAKQKAEREVVEAMIIKIGTRRGRPKGTKKIFTPSGIKKLGRGRPKGTLKANHKII